MPRSRVAARLALAALASTSANLAGCRQVIDDFQVQVADAHDDGGKHDAATDPCHETGYPPPPTTGTSSPDDNVAFVVALHTRNAGDFGQSDARIGYNIDRTCTTSAETTSCAPPQPTQVTTDGPDGIDNSLGQAAFSYYEPPGMVTRGQQSDQKSGNNAYLMQVTGYNGETDDPDVRVAMLSGTMQNADGSGAPPQWDGTDVWKVFAPWVIDPVSWVKLLGPPVPVPKHFAEHAYVSGGILVAQFSELPVSGPTDGAMMYANVFTGRVIESSGIYGLKDGMNAGRWATRTLLAFLAYTDKLMMGYPNPVDCSFPAPSDDLMLDYQKQRDNACGAADVRIEGDDRESPCDAVSFGIAFDGIPAQLGDVVDPGVTGLCVFDSCPWENGNTSDGAAR